jgi:DNA-binding CsgD family transcriptional regulator
MERAGHSLVCPELIGRTSELATLTSLVEQAGEEHGHLALIAGEAGIGKSRLVTRAIALAKEKGFLVVQGACFPTDPGCPYAPVLELVRSVFAACRPGDRNADLDMLASLLYPLLPDLFSSAPDRLPLPPVEPVQAKRRLESLLAQLFLSRGTRAPMLLVVEDLHWSDTSSLDFLHYLARRVLSHSILLLVTYRQDEMQAELRSWLAQLDRERLAYEIQLRTLSRSEVEVMLSTIFDERHTAVDMRRFLNGELLETLYTLTEGNPFFVEETLSALLASGDIFSNLGYWNRRTEQAISIPRSVQDAVQRRTARLGDETRHLLILAAVAGRQFDFTLLQQLTNYDEDQLLSCMKELVAAQLVVEASADQFAFRHALTRQAIYTELLTRERRLLHRTIADALEHYPPDTIDLHLEDLALHFYQAEVWQKVIDFARRAGEKASKLYAHRAAANYFTWVLEGYDHLSLLPPPAVYRARGQAYELLGEFERAQHDYSWALETARISPDPAAEWQSAIDLGFLWSGRDYTQSETWIRQSMLLAQALDDPLLQARSLNRIGNWYLNVEQPHEAVRSHREALTLFERLHDTAGIAETLDLLGMASYLRGDVIGGTAYFQQAIACFNELSDKDGLTSSLATMTLRAPTYQTDALAGAASLSEARRDAEQAQRLAQEIGHRSAEAYALLQLGLCLGSQGEYGRALAAVRQSLDIAEEIEHRQWQTAAHTVLAGLYSGLLSYERAYEHGERALALAEEIGSLFWTRMATGYLTSIAVLRQDLSLAAQLLQDMLTPDMPAETMAQRMLWCASAELALAQGQAEHALEIARQLALSTLPADSNLSSLRVLKLRGDALVRLERSAEAEAALEAAQALAQAQGVRPMYWRVALALGKLYHSERKSLEADQAWRRARSEIESLAETIGEESLRDQFLHQATALFSKAPVSRLDKRQVRHVFGGLTARECEVAILIAHGDSNQAIADALVVTKRTVESHIGNILFKLGCRSRTQIAVWAVETGLASKAVPDT